MINRKRESGSFNPLVLAVAAMALSLVIAIRATAALTPAAATHDSWTAETDGPYGYFPHDAFDRVREFEVMPDMFE